MLMPFDKALDLESKHFAKLLCDPVARRVSGAWVEALPAEAKQAAGPLLSMVSQMGGMAFGTQLGNALAQLWRAKQLQYSLLRSLMGRHKDFWQLTEDGLVFDLGFLVLAYLHRFTHGCPFLWFSGCQTTLALSM